MQPRLLFAASCLAKKSLWLTRARRSHRRVSAVPAPADRRSQPVALPKRALGELNGQNFMPSLVFGRASARDEEAYVAGLLLRMFPIESLSEATVSNTNVHIDPRLGLKHSAFWTRGAWRGEGCHRGVAKSVQQEQQTAILLAQARRKSKETKEQAQLRCLCVLAHLR